MIESNPAKYLVTSTIPGASPDYRRFPESPATYMSPEQVPEADYRVEIGWITEISRPADPVREHVHDMDQIIIFLGSDYRRPQTLGGEIRFYIGGQPVSFNTSAGIFIPRGLVHGPVTWEQYFSPHMQISLMLGNNSPGRYQKETAVIDENFDPEPYVIRSPMREAGSEFTDGRTSPTMTYMSGVQIPGVRTYIEVGWTFGMPVSKRTTGAMPEMVHDRYDEIVLHVGGDPENPRELGADIVFYVGGQPLSFASTCALFIPRDVAHGPIRCLEYRKPHLVMAVMCGAANIREGWEGSFKPEPGR